MKGSRRKFLAGASTTITGLAFGGLVTSASSDDTQSLRSAGIKDRYRSLVKEGKNSQVNDLLEEHNVEHDITVVKPPERAQKSSADEEGNNTSDGPKITPDLWDRDSANLTLYGVHDEGDLYSVDINAQLYLKTSTDTPADRDGMAISFANDAWEIEPDSNESGPYCDNFDPGAEGVLWKVDDLEAFNDGTTPHTPFGHILLEKKLEGEKQNVYGHYCHSYYENGWGEGGTGFSVGFGSLSVSIQGLIDTWKKPTNTIEI